MIFTSMIRSQTPGREHQGLPAIFPNAGELHPLSTITGPIFLRVLRVVEWQEIAGHSILPGPLPGFLFMISPIRIPEALMTDIRTFSGSSHRSLSMEARLILRWAAMAP